MYENHPVDVHVMSWDRVNLYAIGYSLHDALPYPRLYHPRFYNLRPRLTSYLL